MKKQAWKKFFDSGSFHRRGSNGFKDTIKRVDEEFSDTEEVINHGIIPKIEIGAGKKLKCNRYD